MNSPRWSALIGTLVGRLVSAVATNFSALKSSFGDPSSPGALPGTWNEWERNYILPEIPAYRGPDLKENSSVMITNL